VILDISGNLAVAHTGDIIRAYGKGMVWDFSNVSELPFVGKAIEEGIQNDPQLKGQTSVFFFIAKDVELTQAVPAGASGDKQDDGKTDSGGDDGTKQSDGAKDSGGGDSA
jgi:hypothetical protein